MEAEQAKCPPGTRLMPEEERQATLNDLRQARKETEEQILRLPLTMKTMQIQNHKRELEDKVEKLDKAIATFSKQKVYVQM
jgi:hypothetical protein